MADSIENDLVRAADVPATAAVYRVVRRRFRTLDGIYKLVREAKHAYTTQDIHMLGDTWKRYKPDIGFRLQSAPLQVQLDEMQQAQAWLFAVIAYHETLGRGYFFPLFRFAIETDRDKWSEVQELYMVLTDGEDATQQIRVALAVIVHGNHASRLRDVHERANQHMEWQAKHTITPDLVEAREAVANKSRTSKVDGFTCAVSLNTLKRDEDRSCPICQNSHLDFSSFTLEDLIADYPVQIKFCGHIIGKSCLELWIDTPLTDPARYPHRTCPICRVQITGRDLAPPSRELQNHVRFNASCHELKKAVWMKNSECWLAIKRMMSEETALEALRKELLEQKDAEDYNTKQEELDNKLNDLKPLKKALGFGEQLWKKLRAEWQEAGMKT
ncbi:hypothetical protein BDV95DRAFT_612366 [Massariosphaeria phaeospora]|uniref:RING-type domain-containing protein n=1 Tax=Massariosphaeria phaeospora TaxID=100035 RepID=A0A7C8I382_9PLEO|nr:hypothetical protein BDV95DRAFT_612366 [Massariosphaeria phaeospora]